jgi:hypothetical protein
MKFKELSKYSNAEKILLAEKYGIVSKKSVELSSEVKNELENRLYILEEEKAELYSLKM